MAFSFVGSATSSGTSASSAIDTTAATLFVYTQKYDVGAPVTPADSQSNTPTGLTAQDAAFNVSSRQWYVINPTTNAGHTFTAGASAQLIVEAWSGTSPTFDKQGGNNSFPGGTAWAGPSVTPANANSLILAAFGIYGGGVTAVSGVSGGGFSSIRAQLNAGGGILSTASIVQGAIAASQATWANDGSSAIVTAHAVVFYEGGASFIPRGTRAILQAVNRAGTY